MWGSRRYSIGRDSLFWRAPVADCRHLNSLPFLRDCGSLIKRREALVYNTPAGHVTRDIREGVAKLGDLRFKVLDSAGLETASSPADILTRTAEMTKKVLPKSAAAIFLIDARLIGFQIAVF